MNKIFSNILKTTAAASLCLALVPTGAWAATGEEEVVVDQGLELIQDQSQAAAELVNDYFDARAGEVDGSSSVASDDQVTISEEVEEVSQQRVDGFQQMQESAGISITSVSSEVTATDASAAGSGLEATVYEEVTLTYDNLADGVGGTDTCSFGTWHSLSLEKEAGEWTVVEDQFDEADLCGVDTTTSALKAQSTVSTQATNPVYCTEYDPSAAIAYSDKYALKYNSAYRDFNSVGGDCTNYVSQCLYAGGMTFVEGTGKDAWYYKSSVNYTSSWVRAASMVTALKYRGKYVYDPQATDVFPGSPVFYYHSGNWNHAVICVGYDSAGTPIINGHNSNRYHVPYTYWSGPSRCTVQLTTTAEYKKTFYTGSDGIYAESVLMTPDQATPQGTFEWTFENEASVALKSYLGQEAVVDVPETVTVVGADGTAVTYKVSVIDAGAFSGNKAIVQVNLPSLVTKIRREAFKGCSNLTTITGGEGLRLIGDYAFAGCSRLSSVPSFPAVSKVYTYAFYKCKSLTAIDFLPAIKTIDKYAFAKCTGLTQVKIFSTELTYLNAAAFKDCTSLTSFAEASLKLKSVGGYAFYGCTSLKSVNLKSVKLTTIGKKSFWKNSSLKKVKISSSKLKSSKLGTKIFKGAYAKMKLYVPAAKVTKYRYAFQVRGLSWQAKVGKLKA